MAPKCNNPVKLHMQRQSWSTDRQFTHCTDPVTWATATTRRHKVVQQRSTIAQTTPQKRKQNHANTRAQQKKSSQHNKKVLSRMSVNTSTPQRTLHNGRNVLFSSTVLQPTLTRTINGNTSLALPKMLTQKQMCEGAENFVNTHGGPTPGNTNRRCRIRGEKTNEHMKFALPTMCEHNTRPTWHRPHLKQSNCASPYGVAPRDILRNLTHRPCLFNDNVSRRHGQSLPETQIMTGA